MVVCGAVCLILLFCGAIPLKIALALCLNERTGFGTGFSLLSGGRALKAARARALGQKKKRKWKRPSRPPELRPMLGAAFRSGSYLLRRFRIAAISAEGSIALGDAAHTALICGALHSAGGVIPAARVHLQPGFSAAHSDAWFSCIISLRAGHIIIAALMGAWHYLARRYAHGKASD